MDAIPPTRNSRNRSPARRAVARVARHGRLRWHWGDRQRGGPHRGSGCRRRRLPRDACLRGGGSRNHRRRQRSWRQWPGQRSARRRTDRGRTRGRRLDRRRRTPRCRSYSCSCRPQRHHHRPDWLRLTRSKLGDFVGCRVLPFDFSSLERIAEGDRCGAASIDGGQPRIAADRDAMQTEIHGADFAPAIADLQPRLACDALGQGQRQPQRQAQQRCAQDTA